MPLPVSSDSPPRASSSQPRRNRKPWWSWPVVARGPFPVLGKPTPVESAVEPPLPELTTGVVAAETVVRGPLETWWTRGRWTTCRSTCPGDRGDMGGPGGPGGPGGVGGFGGVAVCVAVWTWRSTLSASAALTFRCTSVWLALLPGLRIGRLRLSGSPRLRPSNEVLTAVADCWPAWPWVMPGGSIPDWLADCSCRSRLPPRARLRLPWPSSWLALLPGLRIGRLTFRGSPTLAASSEVATAVADCWPDCACVMPGGSLPDWLADWD